MNGNDTMESLTAAYLEGRLSPVVGTADFRILSRFGLNQILPHIVFRQADLPQTDFYPAAAAQRIAGIKAQIQYQALQMFRIYCRRQIFRVEISDNFDAENLSAAINQIT